MKKICIWVSVLVSILISVGGVVFFLNRQEKEKLEQVNVDEKIVEEEKEDLQEEIKDNFAESDEVQEKVDEEEKEQTEVKSDPTPQQKDISSVSKPKEKEENQSNNSVPTEVKEEKQELEQPTEQSSNNKDTQTPQSEVSTKFYESITGGRKEFSSESEAFARGLEIQNRELDYVIDYNEQHPDTPIQPDINYFRVYPSFIDENGHYWYYLHFFCQSGEGNDEYLKNRF